MIQKIAVLAVSALAIVSPSTAQEAVGSSTASTSWVAPRTPLGHPDLQGIWDTASGPRSGLVQCRLSS